jgi:Tfp pilus assembly ATPase PilU
MAWWTALFAKVQDLSVDEMVLAVGRPPVVRRGTDLLTLGRSPLTAEQTRVLFEAIAPALMLRQVHHLGRAEFEHALDDTTSFWVECHQFRGRIGMILRRTPQRLPHTPGTEER